MHEIAADSANFRYSQSPWMTMTGDTRVFQQFWPLTHRAQISNRCSAARERRASRHQEIGLPEPADGDNAAPHTLAHQFAGDGSGAAHRKVLMELGVPDASVSPLT